MAAGGWIATGIVLGILAAAGAGVFVYILNSTGGDEGPLHVDAQGGLMVKGEFTNQTYTIEFDRNEVPYGATEAAASNGNIAVSGSALRSEGVHLENAKYRIRVFDQDGNLRLGPTSVEVAHTYAWPLWAYPAAWGTAGLAIPLVAWSLVVVTRRERKPIQDELGAPEKGRAVGLSLPAVVPAHAYRSSYPAPRPAPAPATPPPPAAVPAPLPQPPTQRPVTILVHGKLSRAPLAGVPIAVEVHEGPRLATATTDADGAVKLTLPARQLLVGTVLGREGFEDAVDWLGPDQSSLSLELAFAPTATAAQTQRRDEIQASGHALVADLARQDPGLASMVKQVVQAHVDAVDGVANAGGWFLRTHASPSSVRQSLLEESANLVDDISSISNDKGVLNEVASRPSPLAVPRSRPMPTLTGLLTSPTGVEQSQRESTQRLEALDHAITQLASSQPTTLLATWHAVTKTYASREAASGEEAKVARTFSLQARVALLENLVRAVSA